MVARYGRPLGEAKPLVQRGRPHKSDEFLTLYRQLEAASEGRPTRDLRKESFQILEALGYLHRRRQVVESSSLGLLARKREVPPVKSVKDGAKQAREWKVRRINDKLQADLCRALKPITALQIQRKPVPKHLWREFDKVQRALDRANIQGGPGPGAYNVSQADDTTKSRKACSFGPRPDVAEKQKQQQDRCLVSSRRRRTDESGTVSRQLQRHPHHRSSGDPLGDPQSTFIDPLPEIFNDAHWPNLSEFEPDLRELDYSSKPVS